MNHNDMIITEAHWRQLPAELREAPRRALKRKSAIVGRQFLNVAWDLSHRGLYGWKH